MSLKPSETKETIDSDSVMFSLNRSMLSMGASKPWPDALASMTGERQLNASAFIEYFKPLEVWLLTTNKRLGVHIGWEPSDS